MSETAIEFYRPSWAEISRHALAHNVAQIRGAIPSDYGMCAMVKADAYGHGAPQIARWLEAVHVTALGVAAIEEGIELRQAGLRLPILLMGGLMGGGRAAADAVIAHDLTCVIHSRDAIASLEAAATAANKEITVHLKVDTGMTRLGLRCEQLPSIVAALAEASHMRLAGVMSHLAHAVDRDYAAFQARNFTEAATRIAASIPAPLIWHLGNSSAVINAATRAAHTPDLCAPMRRRPGDQVWVRPGIMLYGIAPFAEDEGKLALEPVMSLKSRMTLIKHVPAGTRVSYSGVWEARRASRLATIPIGYADGYAWSGVGEAHVMSGGTTIPVVGRITMDMIICDVTDLPNACVGDEVLCFGADDRGTLRAERVAQWGKTIPYEVVCRVSKRIPRIYTES